MQACPPFPAQVRNNRALVNVHPSGRWTALHQAALAGDAHTVQFLCERDADLHLLNREGQTARQVALAHGNAHCAVLM